MELVGVGFQGGVAADEFSVDDLLNFTNDDVLVGAEDEEEEENSRSRERKHEGNKGLCSDSGETEAFLGSMEISFPADDLADLEWLSQFVDDSFDVSEPLPASSPAEPPGHRDDYRSEPEVHSSPVKFCFNASVPGKARSKRARTGGRVWSLCFRPFPGSPATSGSSSSTRSMSYGTEPGYPFLNQQAKKHKRKGPGREPGFAGSVQQPVRRCSHCGVQKTPQWRAGPMGTKTLCNACGVRFKSGRLFPEYRPACSPTFRSELHSNHHRKVLEMRRQKEAPGQLEQANLEPLPIIEKKALASGLVIPEPTRFGVGEFRHAQMV